jgi:hypothetical protein
MNEQIAGQMMAGLIQSYPQRYRDGKDFKFDQMADDYFKLLDALEAAKTKRPPPVPYKDLG